MEIQFQACDNQRTTAANVSPLILASITASFGFVTAVCLMLVLRYGQPKNQTAMSKPLDHNWFAVKTQLLP